jgi:hypothetical protein
MKDKDANGCQSLKIKAPYYSEIEAGSPRLPWEQHRASLSMTTTRMNRLVHIRNSQQIILLEASSLTVPSLVALTLISKRVSSIRLLAKLWLRELASDFSMPLPEERENTLVFLDPKSSWMAERISLRRSFPSAIPVPKLTAIPKNRQCCYSQGGWS